VRASLIGYEDSIQSVRFLASNPVTDILQEYNPYLPSCAVLVLVIPVALVAYSKQVKPLVAPMKWIASAGHKAVRRPSADEAYRRHRPSR
jgi:hypothetical protein